MFWTLPSTLLVGAGIALALGVLAGLWPALRAASAAGVRMLVLDRPNPLGGMAVNSWPCEVMDATMVPASLRHTCA